MERLKRPSSLSKALIPSSPNRSIKNYSTIASERDNKQFKEYLQDYQEPIDSKNKTNNYADPLTESNTDSFNVEDEFRRKKNYLTDNRQSYFIVKELIMTERTYKKNLDLLTINFRQFLSSRGFNLNEVPSLEQLLYSKSLDPINDFHCRFLKHLEIRLFHWSDSKPISNQRNEHKIGDLLGDLNQILIYYNNFIELYSDILNELEHLCSRSKKFEILFKEFETQKTCYLPFTMFLIKPIQRLIHYKLLVRRLCDFYGPKHHDYFATYHIFIKLAEICKTIDVKLPNIENKQKLMDLQKDLIGVENLAFHANSKRARRFIREGSLQKLSRKGYQQRMFFLFDDMFLYCARSSTPVLQFKVHGEFQLKKIQVEDGNSHINIPNSFTIYSSSRSLLVAAVSQEEKAKWLEDLYEAIDTAKKNAINEDKCNLLAIKSNSSSENNLDSTGADLDDCSRNQESSERLLTKASTSGLQNKLITSNQPSRANTTIHVCWHRNTSVSYIDNHRSLVNQMSGYLLRKFKNSNGWQKLWVVFSNFCLFFYKTYQDEYPLASLPLLGYTVTLPNQSDNITKDFVFKLKFKNHVYFFRAESQYSFERWLEVIESAAQKQCTFTNLE